MIFRRRKCVGKFLLTATSLLILLWIYRGSSPIFLDKALSQEQQQQQQQSFMGHIQNIIISASGKVFSSIHKCVSAVGLFNITANFTINDVLDSMTLTQNHNGLQSDAKMTRTTSIADDVSGLEAADLEIIVIPHSHNDPGWLKTYMKYFEDDTRHILDLIVEKLNLYPDMTFVWVESCFLDTWWTNQTAETREKFRHLVKSGRLELVSGMWVAPDEASTHYFALIDQLIEGHHWVRTNIGVVPQTSLNFDQFGYSTSLPYLMKASGLKNVLIKRIHRGVKQILGKNKWMTFNWRQFWDPAGKHDILTQVDTYEWMSISDSCGPDRSVCRGLDFSTNNGLPHPDSPEAQQPFAYDPFTGARANNFQDYAQRIVRQFKIKSSNYAQKVMMLPHGGDFHYSKSENWKKQYDNLKIFMKYVNDRSKEFNVRMRFGTFMDYFTELQRQNEKYGIQYPTISGDFFTYTEANDYWTGYFTTRQFDKRLSREVLESLRAAELISAILFLDKSATGRLRNEKKRELLANLVLARKELGIFQHHDAITGTSQEHVARDYERRLSSAFSASQEALSSAVSGLLSGQGFQGNPGEQSSPEMPLKPVLIRVGDDKLTEDVVIKVTSEGVRLVMLNSFTQPRKEIVAITVETSNVIVIDDAGNIVEADVVSESNSLYKIIFPVTFQAVSLKVYTLKLASYEPNKDTQSVINTVDLLPGKTFVCENGYINVTYSGKTGSPELLCYKSQNFCTKFELDWRYYKGNGGAYTMISNGNNSPASVGLPSIKTTQGETFCEVRSTYNYFSVVHTLYKTQGVAGKALKVSIHSDLSKYVGFNGDLAMRVITSINNDRLFFVDSNGMQLMGRWVRESIPFDGNVYPMTSMAHIEDANIRLAVHSSQPHGVICSSSGVLDVMIDRVGLRSEMGMPEPVKDNKLTKTMLWLELLSSSEFETLSTKETALPSLNSIHLNDIIQHPIYSFFSHEPHFESQHSISFLRQPMSCDVILANVKHLALEDLQSDGISVTLFRRAVSCNLQKDKDSCTAYENANVDLRALFCRDSNCDVSITERSVSTLTEKSANNNGKTDLSAMDIKTFHIK